MIEMLEAALKTGSMMQIRRTLAQLKPHMKTIDSDFEKLIIRLEDAEKTLLQYVRY